MVNTNEAQPPMNVPIKFPWESDVMMITLNGTKQSKDTCEKKTTLANTLGNINDNLPIKDWSSDLIADFFVN